MASKKTRIEIILEAVDRATGPINERLKQTEQRMAKFKMSTDRIVSGLQGFGTAATATGIAVLGAFGGAVKKAADMERLTMALNTAFQGNEAAATSAFNTIQQFAANTPFQMEEVLRSFLKLKNMGLNPSQAALESYGNTASAMGKSLNDMIEAVADAATGEFERLKEFGIRAKSQGDQVTFTFRGVETTVAKNSEQIEKYLMRIGQTDFAGGMERQSQTLSGRLSTLRDNFDMAAATIGKIFLPAVSDMVAGLTPVLERIAKFAETNPMIFKIAAGFGVAAVALGGFALAAAGIIKAVAIFKTVGAAITIVTGAIKAMSLAVMANPIVLVIAGIAAAAYLIYRNWEPISGFFVQLWDTVTAKFNQFVDFVKNIPSAMYEAGVNIVKSIGDGIASQWDSFIAGWEARIQKIRDFLPFSPAKTGPLKDIHRVKIVETLADSITPEPIRRAMNNAMAPASAQSVSRGISPVAQAGNAGFSVNYAPTININGSVSPETQSSFSAELQRHKAELMRIINEQMANRNRLAYA